MINRIIKVTAKNKFIVFLLVASAVMGRGWSCRACRSTPSRT